MVADMTMNAAERDTGLAAARLDFRDATFEDARLLFDWSNDPAVRQASFCRRPIEWDEHWKWLESRLGGDRAFVLWIAQQGGTPVGQVRYEIIQDRAIVSFSIAREHRGRGLGSGLLRTSGARLLTLRPLERIEALARPDNERSLRALMAAGYQPAGSTSVDGQAALRLVLAVESFGR